MADPGYELGGRQFALSGLDLSLMLDAAEAPHIAYTAGSAPALGDTLQHAWLQDGVFNVEVVDNHGGRSNKSWVRGAPELRLVYNNYGYASTAFEALRNEGGDWSWQSFDVVDASAGLSGIWRDGEVKIAYVSQASVGVEQSAWRYELSFAGSRLPPRWARATQPEVSADIGVVIDASGLAHIVYTMPVEQGLKLSLEAPRDVFYTTVRGTEWSEPELLSTVPGYYGGLSLAIDADGRVHVTYTTTRFTSFDPVETTGEINYVTRRGDGAGWRRETVPSAGSARTARESLAVRSGIVQLVYCELTADGRFCNGLHRAMLDGAGWSREVIDQGCEDLGRFATLALGADGRVHVAYQGCDRRLMYAERDGGFD